MSNLIDLGVRQFKFMPLGLCDEGFIKSLSGYRSTDLFRSKMAKKEDYILIVSQDCDIHSRAFSFIEVIVFRKAKSKDRRGSQVIEYARNVHKLFLRDDDDYVLKKEELCLLPKEVLIEELSRLKGRGEIGLSDFSTENTKSILMSWLVNYYARRPLPDGFNRALFDKYIKSEEGHPLRSFLLKYYNEILDVYAFIFPMEDEDASEYDVTLTALLSQTCTEEKINEINHELEGIVHDIQRVEARLNMMQATGNCLHDAALMDFVLMPHDFSMEDAFQTRKLTLDFLCWMPKEDE